MDETPEDSTRDPSWLMGTREVLMTGAVAMIQTERIFSLIVGGDITDRLLRAGTPPMMVALMTLAGLILCMFCIVGIIMFMKVHENPEYSQQVPMAARAMLSFFQLITSTLLVIGITLLIEMTIKGGNIENFISTYLINYAVLALGLVFIQTIVAWLIGALTKGKIHDLLVDKKSKKDAAHSM
jgi:hypothetical protein